MKWNGDYHIKCPKCGCRKIWATEITEGDSLHLIDNGVWDHFYDNNDYGDIVRTECKCDECGHTWNKPHVSIEYWNIDSIKERKRRNKQSSNTFLDEMKTLVGVAKKLTNEFNKLNK